MLGGWVLEDFKDVKLPQKVASGIAAVTGGMIGADYQPVVCLAHKVVNGTDYCVYAVQRIIAENSEERLVKMVINEAPNGNFSLVSVSGVAL